MIKVRPAGERGKTRAPWLDGNHTFSFNRYYDPSWTGFRDLVVINEDFVAPSSGFPPHSHADMEIITYVIEGALEHRDSSGGHGVIRPGEVQKMSAGTGVTHSETNPSPEEPVHLLQIWIRPERDGLKPYYEQKAFPEDERRGRLRLVAAPKGADGAVTLYQDVRLYDALLAEGDEVTHALQPGRHSWVQVVKGAVTLNGKQLTAGDGAAVSDEESLTIRGDQESEVLLFDLA
ncbi:MAG: quercetin 2,3-dioxygenase [Acidobacteriota bacterium]|jgi:redox-sensitive bicupin YhaK (pirin superfamily)|nr:quercetin 2,3-dioxygenase [Acidobacteriota bacterium]